MYLPEPLIVPYLILLDALISNASTTSAMLSTSLEEKVTIWFRFLPGGVFSATGTEEVIRVEKSSIVFIVDRRAGISGIANFL